MTTIKKVIVRSPSGDSLMRWCSKVVCDVRGVLWFHPYFDGESLIRVDAGSWRFEKKTGDYFVYAVD